MSRAEPTYQATAYHKELSGGIARGQIRLSEGDIHFESVSGSDKVAFPLQGIQIRRGGATGEHVFFTHPLVADWTLTTTDSSILSNPYLKAHKGAARQAKKFGRAHKFLLLGCGVVLLFLAAAIFALFASKEALITAAAEHIPPEWEARMGDVAFAQIKTTSPMVEDEQLVSELRTMAEPLLKAVPDKRWTYKLHLVRADEPNAFALPGGNIVVHTGLIQAAERPEEVLGVLAHEVAHVTRRHGVRQLLSRAGLALLLQAVVGDAEGLLGFLVDSGSYLLTQRYSRDYEREADDTGWEYLVSAGISPEGLLDFFRRLKALEQKGDTLAVPELLSTHPATDARIARLEEKWKEYSGKNKPQPVPFDFEQFKSRLEKAAPVGSAPVPAPK